MIIQRVENPQFLSNAYLVVDRPGGSGVLVDSNEVTDPLIERVEREGTTITHILVTHHHYDHVVGLSELRERVGNPPVFAHPGAADHLEVALDGKLVEGATLESGDLRIRAIETPGHTGDHLALAIGDGDVITADLLFKGTVGGTRAPGATGFDDLKSSIMEKLMQLPRETRVHPGHRQPTTIGAEWERNPFIRIWRGLDGESDERVQVGAQEIDRAPATLVLWAPDYDGGNKAWVRFDDGTDAIVGGSQVVRS